MVLNAATISILWLFLAAVCAVSSPPFALAQGVSSQAKEQRILQVQELLQQGDLAGARQLLALALQQFPTDAGLDNLLGILEAQEHNYQAAETALRRAVARSPQFTNAYLNLGRLYQENSATDPAALSKAVRAYQRILQYQPSHTEANYQIAVLLQRRGEFKLSLVHLLRLPPAQQQSPQVLAMLCATYAGLGQSEKADELATALLAHSELAEADVLAVVPVLVPAHGNEAAAKSLSHKVAVKLLTGLFERNLAASASFHQLGLVYERQGELARARAMLEKAASTETVAPNLLFDLARVARQQKDLRGALGYLAHALDLTPNESILHYAFGQICAELNLVAEAHKAFLQAVSLEPNNAAYNYAMGIVSTWRHDPGEAIPYFQKYMQLLPADPRGQLALGATYFKIKNYAAARRELTIASKNKATAGEAHYYLGRLARQENKLAEAITELKLSLTSLPNHADAWAELGMCQLLSKDFALAQQSLARALRIDADHYAANFNLLLLYSRTKDAQEAEQAKRFEAVRQRRAERTQDMLRLIEAKPAHEN
jgi:tetratricopeptide (TPR) repeat protein